MDTYRVTPHGGELVDLIVDAEEAGELKAESRDLFSLTLTNRHIADLELLMNGAFSPLRGFMTRAEYESVSETMRLTDGTVWPLPICLDITEQEAKAIVLGDRVALRDAEGFMLAVMTAEEVWPMDKAAEADRIYETRDESHPGVSRLFNHAGTHYVGGPVKGIQFPIHYAFRRHRHTPAEMRALYRKLGWRRILGFHTRNPIHRIQFELTLRAMAQVRANLLVQPVVQRVKPGDIDIFTRIRCYLEVMHKYPPNMMLLSLLPFAMRMAGPREAVLHAVIRKNYGCTHFYMGPNHANPGNGGDGRPFYKTNAARDLALSFGDDLGIEIVSSGEIVYAREEDAYMPADEAPAGDVILRLSDDEFNRKIRYGRRVPEWFTFPEVIDVLQNAHPPRHRQGVTIFCTGLSGAGKSTIARVLYSRFLEMGGRPVTLLDGDIVRRNLSNELGFSKEHRDINVRRIGFVASEITKNRGIAICAPIAPYNATRRAIRELIEQYGGFIEVYVSTPLETCELRDRKGLYAKARAGMIQGFTGVNDPYEPPVRPEVTVDTTDMTPDESAQEALLYLERAGYIR